MISREEMLDTAREIVEEGRKSENSQAQKALMIAQAVAKLYKLEGVDEYSAAYVLTHIGSTLLESQEDYFSIGQAFLYYATAYFVLSGNDED